jgi:hypothetical protein
VSLFSKTWAEMTPEDRRAFDARLSAAREAIQASIDAGRPKLAVAPEPAYLRDGVRLIEWRGMTAP